MTNEEAIKRMKWTKGRTGITSEEAEAIGYAIEKLSNSDEDCISRAEAQKHIYQRLWESALNNVGYECKAEDVFMDIADNRLRTWISEIPSIQPKPKTDVLAKIRAEIEQVKSIMNEEIINHDRKDLINFVNGLNQSLAIIDKYKAENTSDCDSCKYQNEVNGSNCYECVKGIRNNYTTESEG